MFLLLNFNLTIKTEWRKNIKNYYKNLLQKNLI